MSEKIRVVHYINQFYAGIGGEEKASTGISVRQGPVGPGVLLQADLGDRYEVTRTIICGDNYIAEHTPEAAAQIVELVREAGAQLFVAGPGFNAGRYGIGCGAATAAVTEKLKIPAVTALYSENPGTDLYQDRCYILMTENNALKMRRVMGEIAAFADRLVRGEPIGDGEAEHFHGSGPAIEIHYEIPAAKRGIDMLLKKFRGEPFRTEVRMPGHENIPVPVLKKPLSEAVIAVVTDGGLVPTGNPDHLPVTNSREYKRYDYCSPDRMDPESFEVRHQGYNNFFVQQDPNRLVPLDALRVICGEHKIGGIFGAFYTTAGVMTSMENGKKFGEGIAADLIQNHVDAVLLTST